MSYSDIDHFSSMVTGCESINQGMYRAPEARYASGVLRLHAQDLGVVAGQEGFLDSIKRGAQNVVKWVKQLMTAIGNWFKSIYSKFTGKEVKDKLTLSKEVSETILAPNLERVLIELNAINSVDVSDLVKDVEKYLSEAKKGGDLSKIHETVTTELRNVKDKLEKQVRSLKENNDDDNATASKLGTDLKRIADASNILFLSIKKVINGFEWKPNESFVKAVDVGGNRARAGLMAELENARNDLDDVKKSVKYAESKVSDLWVPYEENNLSKPIEKDRSKWTADVYYEMSAASQLNFSKERFQNLMAINQHLRDNKVKGFEKVG